MALEAEVLIRIKNYSFANFHTRMAGKSMATFVNVMPKCHSGYCCFKLRNLSRYCICRAGSGLYSAGSGFTLWAWAFVGLAWPGGRAWGLDCRLTPKTQPARARALGLCSKSPSTHVGLGPGPAPSLVFYLKDNSETKHMKM
jgi:hypothetical protein